MLMEFVFFQTFCFFLKCVKPELNLGKEGNLWNSINLASKSPYK